MRFRTMLFNIVERCNIRCRHCGYADSRRPGRIAEADLVDWVRQAAAYGIPVINFSGGETFLKRDLLEAGVRAAHEADVLSGVFTNGYWGENEEVARRTLLRLPGLAFLHLSCDRFHQEWVPAERLLHIVRAAASLEKPPRVIVSGCYTHPDERSEIAALFTGLPVVFHFQPVISSPQVEAQVPEAAVTARPLRDLGFSDTCYLHSPTVHTSGHLWACHIGTVETHPDDYDVEGSAYLLGDLHAEPMAEIFDRAESNGVYQMLRVFGPAAVAASALASPSREELGDCRFAGDCDMCYQMTARPEVVAELAAQAARPEVARKIVLARRILLGEPA